MRQLPRVTGTECLPWLSRMESSMKLSSKVYGGNFIQMATVDTFGLPHCRTVVFRGFLPYNHDGIITAMKIVTDSRSEKVAHVRFNAMTELVWWFPMSSEQYRVQGRVETIDSRSAMTTHLQDARNEAWRQLRETTQVSFYGYPPGQPYQPLNTIMDGATQEDCNPSSDDPPDTFLLLLVVPTCVKYLRLHDNFAQVDRFCEESGVWTRERVHP
jgi:pyridoxamine 5'-phosphate oxidase